MPTSIRAKAVLPVIAVITACSALILLLASGMGSHVGLWHFRTGFTLLKYGALLGAGSAVFGAAALALSSRRRTWKTAFLSGMTVIIGVTSFAIPYSWKQTATRLPKIHDISTDTANPPSFVSILPLRKSAPNQAGYGGAEIAARQAEAYPDLKTFFLPLPQDQAFGLALDTAQQLGWHIVAAVPTEGRIEASDTTFWFGFVDDIVIRIRPSGSGALLDIRSLSRVGLSDVGTNAARIRRFISRMKS